MGTKSKKEILEVESTLLPNESGSIPIEVQNIEPEDDNIEVLGSNQQYSLAMYMDKNVDSKYLTKFIKAVEKFVRQNDDYRMWLSALREEPQLSQDAFLHNISSQEAEIQLHHFPFNLYNIVQVITESMLAKNERVSTFIVADRVIRLHFDGVVGLVPLSITMHQLAHLGKVKFLRSQIYGKWEQFYNEYKDYMDDYDHTVVRTLVETKCLEMKHEDLVMLGYKGESPDEPYNGLEDEFFDDNDEELENA